MLDFLLKSKKNITALFFTRNRNDYKNIGFSVASLIMCNIKQQFYFTHNIKKCFFCYELHKKQHNKSILLLHFLSKNSIYEPIYKKIYTNNNENINNYRIIKKNTPSITLAKINVISIHHLSKDNRIYILDLLDQYIGQLETQRYNLLFISPKLYMGNLKIINYIIFNIKHNDKNIYRCHNIAILKKIYNNNKGKYILHHLTKNKQYTIFVLNKISLYLIFLVSMNFLHNQILLLKNITYINKCIFNLKNSRSFKYIIEDFILNKWVT